MNSLRPMDEEIKVCESATLDMFLNTNLFFLKVIRYIVFNIIHEHFVATTQFAPVLFM